MVCTGAVSLAVLNFYINAMGGKLKFGLLMSWFLLVEAARVGATVWLSHWTDTVDAPGGKVTRQHRAASLDRRTHSNVLVTLAKALQRRLTAPETQSVARIGLFDRSMKEKGKLKDRVTRSSPVR